MENRNTLSRHESNWGLVGLVAIVISTLVVEIALTKFFAYKVYHHFTFAILGLVILGLGRSGVYVYLRSGTFDGLGWATTAFGLVAVLLTQSVVFAVLLLFISLKARHLIQMIPAYCYKGYVNSHASIFPGC